MAFNEESIDGVLDFMWNNDVAVELVFDHRKGTIRRYHVEALMIQLFAVGILQMTGVKRDGSGLIVLAREKATLQQYNQDRYKRKDAYTFIATLDEIKKDRKY